MLLRKYPLKLFKYWFVGYIIGVFLAVIFVALQNFLSSDSDINSNGGNPLLSYARDNWVYFNQPINIWSYIAQWPPSIRGIDCLMHIDKGENRSVADALAQRIRVFCIVMTSPKHLKERAQIVKNTWGLRCDGLIFMSTQADQTLPAVAVNTSKDNPWGRFQETFQYVYRHHFDEADWFIKAHDNTYIIVENLKYMLNNYSSSEASYFGYMPDGDTNEEEKSSKAGYILSKEALNTIVQWGSYLCKTNFKLSECLKRLKIRKVDTHDSGGHARFFPYHPAQSSTGASDFAISFHKITATYLYVMDYFVYHLRPYGIVANYSVPDPYQYHRAVPVPPVNRKVPPVNKKVPPVNKTPPVNKIPPANKELGNPV